MQAESEDDEFDLGSDIGCMIGIHFDEKVGVHNLYTFSFS